MFVDKHELPEPFLKRIWVMVEPLEWRREPVPLKNKAAIGILLQVGIWVLVFVSWGLDDLGGFFSHPARAGVVLVGILGTVLAFVLVPMAHLDPFRKGERPVVGQRWVLGAFVVLAVFFAPFMPYADRRGLLVFADSEFLRYVGLVLNAGGSAIRLFGLRTLGKQFSGYVTLQKEHELVQTGMYSVIRHPMYLGALLAFAGWGLVFRSWLTIPALVLTGALIAVRIRGEEKLLAETFGEAFEDYRRRTWRLVPFIY